ncbi:54S ribosomal protein [Penicillium chermesinum]|uniref:Large ribosomal subunit protein uL23m n=1 Tax=Penicillium chermesinum TaxID=63820 RepID=A0A9W9PGB3_9EURO|nr:54S ribosomal protein [Penicillium chermesinum]KAJ5246240.1 54S ribosomal protein [Penicillium chermesinum]
MSCSCSISFVWANRLNPCSPEFTVALVRTPFLTPRHAQFRVPLEFNKLDLRDYLKRGYGVDVLGIRSYIEQKPITRITRDGRNLGQWRRPKSQKRMTVELVEPFVYPEEPKDMSPWEKEAWDSAAKYQDKVQKQNRQKGHSAEEPDTELREAYKKQAEELKENKSGWRPTWKALGVDFAHKELANNGGYRNPLPKYLGGRR